MKKLSIALAAVALLASACQSKEEQFKLTVTGLPESANGTYAVIHDANDNAIDSVAIENGGFVYTAAANDTVAGTIVFDNTPFIFAYEPGEYTITKNADNTYLRGGDANSQFVKVQSFSDELKALTSKYEPQIQQLQAAYPDGQQMTDEDREKLYEIQENYSEEYKDICEKYITKGGNSIVDYIAFSTIAGQLEPDEFIEYYEAAGSLIKSDKDLATVYPVMQAAARTDEGGKFVDYQITNPAGETKALSEFRAEGKYFLLDFFASWCGPCQKSMPVLSEIQKTYSNILTTASIAIWERDTDGTAYAQAVKDHKITWSTMQDASSAGATSYGIMGVPTFILFSPEGEIIKRTHDINEIKSKLEEVK